MDTVECGATALFTTSRCALAFVPVDFMIVVRTYDLRESLRCEKPSVIQNNLHFARPSTGELPSGSVQTPSGRD